MGRLFPAVPSTPPLALRANNRCSRSCRLISAFFKITGVPMVLNTSFNVMGEPIVDSPQGVERHDKRESKATTLLERVVGPNSLPTIRDCARRNVRKHLLDHSISRETCAPRGPPPPRLPFLDPTICDSQVEAVYHQP